MFFVLHSFDAFNRDITRLLITSLQCDGAVSIADTHIQRCAAHSDWYNRSNGNRIDTAFRDNENTNNTFVFTKQIQLIFRFECLFPLLMLALSFFVWQRLFLLLLRFDRHPPHHFVYSSFTWTKLLFLFSYCFQYIFSAYPRSHPFAANQSLLSL